MSFDKTFTSPCGQWFPLLFVPLFQIVMGVHFSRACCAKVGSWGMVTQDYRLLYKLKHAQSGDNVHVAWVTRGRVKRYCMGGVCISWRKGENCVCDLLHWSRIEGRTCAGDLGRAETCIDDLVQSRIESKNCVHVISLIPVTFRQNIIECEARTGDLGGTSEWSFSNRRMSPACWLLSD